MTDVMFSEPADYDLIDIEYYISTHLFNYQAADRIVDGIIKEAADLLAFPKKYPVVSDSLFARLGLRIAFFDNYNIFYIYLEDKDLVFVIRVLYNKADWKNILLGYDL
ncbi:MAG: type II toxin-antitoxin system RelE/ParE family toxin [Lachnospiraceae bacterium]|nr:type II toxin-antitoxin system RelE/ParE family toxin [Lachnospiraceae bacterium]